MFKKKEKNLPFQNIPVVIRQIASTNELRDLDRFSHGCKWQERVFLRTISRWQYQHATQMQQLDGIGRNVYNLKDNTT